MRANAGMPLHREAVQQREESPVAKRLNDALVAKLVSVLRSRRHHFLARRLESSDAAEMFLDHSNAEQGHADLIAERIVQLGEEPEFSPAALTSPVHAFRESGGRLQDMVLEDLEATRSGMEALRDFARFIGSRDAATRRLLRTLLDADQARADELAAALDPRPQRKIARA
jgi:bacterioferritin